MKYLYVTDGHAKQDKRFTNYDDMDDDVDENNNMDNDDNMDNEDDMDGENDVDICLLYTSAAADE